MVGQDAGAGIHAIGLPIGSHLQVSRGLGHRIGAARPQRFLFCGGNLARLAETLRAAVTEETDIQPPDSG